MLDVRVDDDFLDAAGPELAIVANYAVGVNNVDLDAAWAQGVVVTNTPDVLTRSTAELALTLMLSLLRGSPRATGSCGGGSGGSSRSSSCSARASTGRSS